MKKNLAKHITLGIMVGTMLMGSSAAYAEDGISMNFVPRGAVEPNVVGLAAGDAYVASNGSIVISAGDGTGASDFESSASNLATHSVVIGASSNSFDEYNTVIGANNSVGGKHNVVIGDHITVATQMGGSKSVILGYGSSNMGQSDVVSVGSGVVAAANDPYPAPQYRRIINVADGVNANDAVTKGQLDAALANVSGGSVDAYTKTESDSRYVQISSNTAGNNQPNISIDSDGQMVFGTTSSWIDGDGEGFFAGRIDTNEGHTADNAKAAMTSEGQVIAQEFILKNGTTQINVKDALDTKADKATNLAGYGITDAYTKAEVYNKTEADSLLATKANAADVYQKTEVYNKTETDDKLADKADKATTLEGYGITDAYTKTDIDSMIGGNTAAVSGLNQRIDSLDSRLDKVGAGAAALAALHPLDYDADNKLSFAAGMGNYGGETAAAVGAFYRPNEDVMLSLGGTAGNGENMVNLGVSFAIGKGSSGVAKLSKAELVNKVQQMEAENAAMKAENKEVRYEINNVKAENQNLKEELAMMKVMLQEIAAKI